MIPKGHYLRTQLWLALLNIQALDNKKRFPKCSKYKLLQKDHGTTVIASPDMTRGQLIITIPVFLPVQASFSIFSELFVWLSH